ncbi:MULTISPECIES: hypothetical protein [unclassified Streptomyces]|uniref:hypothetical protein n=1 Tax=unclassified Streptomyces TaxID=2593676 RepID=UPI000DC52E2D|nr:MULTISPECIES: hypothetical protein [unclassified Streptomyces]RAJ74803.1 hypothetical protein K377_06569 [Streptomyces sp. PsTaAH-137]
MDVPLWLALIAVGWLGIKLTRPPIWLVILLLLGGYLIADSFLSPAVDSLIN